MKLFFITILFLLTIGIVFPANASAADTYPYPTAITCDEACQADQWGFYKRQCTSYASWKVNESGTNMTNWMQGPNGKSGIFGNAENWDNNASIIGTIVTSIPQIKAVAQWEPFHSGAGSAGHVAFVESINSDSSVNISEYNFYTRNGYGTRNNVRADHYLVFGNANSTACGGSNAQISNQTINSGAVFNCAASKEVKIEAEFRSVTGSSTHVYTN